MKTDDEIIARNVLKDPHISITRVQHIQGQHTTTHNDRLLIAMAIKTLHS